MHNGLLLSKRLFIEASTYADRTDPVSAGIAISMLQDSVEMYLWALIKARGVPTKDQDGFNAYISKLRQAGVDIPRGGELVDLNKARVNFKHNGNLPAPEEANKHKWAVESFYRDATPLHFQISFDEISMVQLVGDAEIRSFLLTAEGYLDSGDFVPCSAELAKAKALLFRQFDKFIPDGASNLRQFDRLFARGVNGLTGQPFAFLAEYLAMLREASLVSLLRLPLADYHCLRQGLPNAVRSLAGEWQVMHSPRELSEPDLRRARDCIINLHIRLQAIQVE